MNKSRRNYTIDELKQLIGLILGQPATSAAWPNYNKISRERTPPGVYRSKKAALYLDIRIALYREAEGKFDRAFAIAEFQNKLRTVLPSVLDLIGPLGDIANFVTEPVGLQ
jgi:hypothetical protein